MSDVEIRTIPSLNPVDAIKLAAGRLSDFKGRSRRSEFWWWMAVVLISQVAIGWLLGNNEQASGIINILIMACALSVTVRRLQDTGNHALWVFVSFALGIAVTFYTAFGEMSHFTSEYRQIFEAYGTNIPTKMFDRLMDKYSSVILIYGTMMLAWLISSLVVVIMCLLDGKPLDNKYGSSPKYIVIKEEPLFKEQ